MKKFLALVLTLCFLLTFAPALPAQAEEVVTLKWVNIGNGMPDNYEAWKEKINPYLAEKIGVNIEMEIISWGDWDTRRSTIINSNEEYDIIFGNNHTFNPDVALGAYLPIEDLVKEHAPKLLELIPAPYWDAAKVGGHVYAVPTYKDSSQSNYFVWDTAMLKKYNLDVTNVHTLPEATEALQTIADGEKKPSFPMHKAGFGLLFYQYDQMSTGLPAIGVRYDDKDAKVVGTFEQADVMEVLETLHAWQKSGIINSDAATVAEDSTTYKACGIAQGWPSAAKTVWGPNMGIDAVAIQYKNTILSNETVQGSMNSISVNSKHPEKAIKFLELINTDSYVRDSFWHGLEGENWVYTADGKLQKDDSKNWGMAGYSQATFFAGTQLTTDENNQWAEVKALNEAAEPSVLLGFAFDYKKVENQIANCTEIFKRWSGELLTGTVDPKEAVPAMYEEMRAAGFDEIVAEAQAQVDAFMAAK